VVDAPRIAGLVESLLSLVIGNHELGMATVCHIVISSVLSG